MSRFFFVKAFTVTLLIAVFQFLIVIQTHADESKFSPILWKQQLNEVSGPDGRKYVSRADEFAKLFRDYNLIGMSRTEVISLLGTEDRRDGYLVMSVEDSVTDFQLEYENEKVKQFRTLGFDRHRDRPWQTHNMLWTIQTDFTPKEKPTH